MIEIIPKGFDVVAVLFLQNRHQKMPLVAIDTLPELYYISLFQGTYMLSFSKIFYMSDSDRGSGCRLYGAKSFEGSAAAFSASFCRFIFLGLRFTSAMMPVWSNSLMAIRSISF